MFLVCVSQSWIGSLILGVLFSPFCLQKLRWIDTLCVPHDDTVFILSSIASVHRVPCNSDIASLAHGTLPPSISTRLYSTMIHCTSPPPSYVVLCLTNDPRPRPHEVDDTRPVHGNVLLCDHLDRLLRDHPPEKRRRIREVRRRRARPVGNNRQRPRISMERRGRGRTALRRRCRFLPREARRFVRREPGSLLSTLLRSPLVESKEHEYARLGGRVRGGRTGAAVEQRGERGEAEVRRCFFRGHLQGCG